MHKPLRLTVCRMVFIVTVAAGLIPISVSAQDYPSTQEPGDQPSYPGIPPSQKKLEGTLGDYNLRAYGTVLLNISASDTPPVGGDVPLWAPPGSGRTTFLDGTTKRVDDVHDLIFTARQSVFGFMVKPSSPSTDTWQPSGKLEFDLFGTRPVDNNLSQGRVLNQPRLRFAYFQFAKKDWKITAGQDKAILAPLDPVSLSHVAVPLGATAGNLWAWLPQVRLDLTHKMGNASTLFQFGILRPSFADPRLGDLPNGGTPGASLEGAPGLGERAAQPFYQSRVAVSYPLNGSNLTVGASGHYGRERIGATRTLDSWAFAIDYAVPLHSRLTWRGENFVGSNLVPFQGGIIQGVAFLQPIATAPPTRFNRIGAGGGWTELIIKATTDRKNVFYLGVSEDDPRDRHLLTGSGRSRNAMAWASYFRKLSDEVTVAFEWSNWQFKTRGFVGGVAGPQGPSGTANVFNLSLAYQF
ncbi:MAG: hypothetical protein DMG15_20265 [Acidobacteria bacterium]|nr:MAG: hypothetical protein DMG15_20265 [Acidobacteriota bacterium]